MKEKITYKVCIHDVCNIGTHRYCYEHSILHLHLSLRCTAVLSIEISNYFMTSTCTDQIFQLAGKVWKSVHFEHKPFIVRHHGNCEDGPSVIHVKCLNYN